MNDIGGPERNFFVQPNFWVGLSKGNPLRSLRSQVGSRFWKVPRLFGAHHCRKDLDCGVFCCFKPKASDFLQGSCASLGHFRSDADIFLQLGFSLPNRQKDNVPSNRLCQRDNWALGGHPLSCRASCTRRASMKSLKQRRDQKKTD